MAGLFMLSVMFPELKRLRSLISLRYYDPEDRAISWYQVLHTVPGSQRKKVYDPDYPDGEEYHVFNAVTALLHTYFLFYLYLQFKVL